MFGYKCRLLLVPEFVSLKNVSSPYAEIFYKVPCLGKYPALINEE